MLMKCHQKTFCIFSCIVSLLSVNKLEYNYRFLRSSCCGFYVMKENLRCVNFDICYYRQFEDPRLSVANVAPLSWHPSVCNVSCCNYQV